MPFRQSVAALLSAPSTAFLHALLSGDAQAAYAQLQPVDQSPKSMDTLRNTVAALAPCVQSNAQTDYQTGLQAFGYVEVEAVFNPPCVRLRLMTHQYLPSDIGRVCVVQTIQINGRWRPALMGSRSFFCGKSDSGY